MELKLKNPHSILAAIENRPEAVSQISFSGDLKKLDQSNDWFKVLELARSKKIRISSGQSNVDRSKIESGRGALGEALVTERSPEEMESILIKNPKNGIWLALDCVQDPQNLGSIFRSAAFFGIKGILLPKDRTATITATVYDVASGGVEFVRHAMVTNLSRTIEDAKELGYWILGTSEHADLPVSKVDRDRAWLVILGNEGKGMRRLISEACDQVCTIPQIGGVGSLNVSVASGILLSYLTSI